MFMFTLEHVCSYRATLRSPFEVIGETPPGLRLNAYVTGGEVDGPRIRGRLLPVGGDWLVVRHDGVGMVDVRASIETHDGALIYLQYQGVVDLGEDGYARLLAGDPPARAPIRVAPRLSSAHPAYRLVERHQFFNVGEVDFATSSVCYDMYMAVSPGA